MRPIMRVMRAMTVRGTWRAWGIGANGFPYLRHPPISAYAQWHAPCEDIGYRLAALS